MYSSVFLSVILQCLLNLLGCWHINGSLSYRITEEGDTVFISKESENVSPQVTFLYSHKGSIKYGDGNFVCFRWQEIPENRIKITFFHDSATNRILSVQNTDDRLELWENKDSDSVNKYIMSKTDYIIEEYNGKKLKVTKEEYKYLMNNNPFKDLQCYVAVGRENGSKLQIGGQEYLEVIHQQPDTSNQRDRFLIEKSLADQGSDQGTILCSVIND